MSKDYPPIENKTAADKPRINVFSAGFDRIRVWFIGIPKTDMFCVVLAMLVLAISVPFYAFNRTAENVASFHCQSLFRYVPESVATGSAEAMLQLKQPLLKFLDDGLPSFIWCFSWSLLMLLIWKSGNNSFDKWFWCLFPAVANLFWELFQKIEIIPGAASAADCVFGILGAVLVYGMYEFIFNYRRVTLCSGKDC